MTQPINITPNAAPPAPPPPKPGISASLIGGLLLIAVALVGGVELGRTVLAPQPPAPTPAPPAPPAAVAISGPASASVGRQVKLAIKGASGARTEWTLPPGDFEQDTGGALAYFVPTSATPSPAVFTAKTLVVQGSAIIDGPTGSFSLPITTPTPVTPPAPITPPSPSPQTDGGAMGRAILAVMPSVEIAGEQAMHDSILTGTNMAAVMAAGKAARQTTYAAILSAQQAPVLGKIIPEGTEPPDQATRAKWAAAVADSISSLGGGK